LGGLASSPDEVGAPQHAKTASDGSDVDDDKKVTVGSVHLREHARHGGAQFLALAIAAFHLDTVHGPEANCCATTLGKVREFSIERCAYLVFTHEYLIIYHE
jgi:hypothetical protein